jgi:phage-related tail protein
MTPSADQYALFLFYEAKKKAAIDKSLEEQKKNDGESLKYISFYYDTIQKQALKLVEIDTGHSKKTASNLKDMTRATNELAGAFDTLFSGGKNGWKDLENYMLSFFEKMISEVLDAIVVWCVLNIVSGDAAAGAGTLDHFIGKVLGFAGGTNYAPGGLAIVGEHGPELVNLPRGSQVIPNTQLGGGELTCRVSGGDLLFVLNTQSRKMNSYR